MVLCSHHHVNVLAYEFQSISLKLSAVVSAFAVKFILFRRVLKIFWSPTLADYQLLGRLMSSLNTLKDQNA